ncbi:biopolymer transporter ExbD [uncultured Parasutterella sp.]|uniref:ExbD/TolR family protein n=2 Tax=uncultured Parasutterella sp. TaxID=1263098 RepID=UPI0025924FBF|nr:biopolymer transporter ExbD [uncultured Parasutterella sp.]
MLRVKPQADQDATTDLTSLIDVVFILLIFFILAASFAVHSIDFDLPAARTSKALSGRVVEIRLNRDGTFLCDGVPTKKEELDERLASIIVQFKARPGQIVLMADPKAPAGEMIYLVDTVRQHGGEKLHVATAPRAEK